MLDRYIVLDLEDGFVYSAEDHSCVGIIHSVHLDVEQNTRPLHVYGKQDPVDFAQGCRNKKLEISLSFVKSERPPLRIS